MVPDNADPSKVNYFVGWASKTPTANYKALDYDTAGNMTDWSDGDAISIKVDGDTLSILLLVDTNLYRVHIPIEGFLYCKLYGRRR